MNLVWNWWAVPGTLVFFGAWACAIIALRTAPHKPLNRHLSIVLILEGLYVGCALGFLFFFENHGLVQVFAACGTATMIAIPYQYLSFLAVSLKTPLLLPFRSRTASVLLGALSVIGAALVLTNPQLFMSELYSPEFAPWNFRYESLGLWAVQFYGVTALFGLLAAVSAYIIAQPGSAARNRAKWFAIAFGVWDVCLGLTLILYPAIRPIPFWGDFIFNPGTALMYFVYVLLLAYAVLKMQLFDIHLKVKFVIQKGTVVAMVGGMFLVGSELLEALLPVQSTILGVVVALVILALLRPIQRLALRMTGNIMQGVDETAVYFDARKIEVYTAAFEGAMEDGVVTQKERTILMRLQHKLDLSENDANAVEQSFVPKKIKPPLFGNLFLELKRRNVYKITTVYLVVGWVLLQAAQALFPVLEIPDSATIAMAILLFFGFPLVLLFAWMFELTPEGIKLTQGADLEETVAISKRVYIVNASLLILIGIVTTQQLAIINRSIDEELTLSPDSKSIAVLPLANLSPDPNNDYFAAGVHEEILNQLAKISEIKVVSRTAVLRYQGTTQSPGDIARELNVSTIMEGSVRFADNRVSITTQLIRAIDDTHLWSETYQFELDDIFAIQSDVALQVANAMHATLLPGEIARIESPATESTEAYTLFLQHRYQSAQESARQTLDEDGWIEAGIRKMERAIMLDPLFARGFAELGYLKWIKGVISRSEEASELSDEALFYANRAIEIDPTIARAYVALQRVSFDRRQWDEWESYARQSVELPDLYGRAAFNFARALSLIEKYEEAYYWIDVAISKEPSIPFYREQAVVARIQGRDYETALIMAEQFLAVGGDENAYHAMRAYTLNRLDKPAESVNELNEMSTEPMVVSLDAIRGFYDYLRCQSGEQDSVMEELEKLESELIRELRIVYCEAGEGDLDAMFQSFQRTMNRGRLIYFADIVSDEVRADPRWQVVEEYMNLPSY